MPLSLLRVSSLGDTAHLVQDGELPRTEEQRSKWDLCCSTQRRVARRPSPTAYVEGADKTMNKHICVVHNSYNAHNTLQYIKYVAYTTPRIPKPTHQIRHVLV